ncbi:MAG TPA: fatty acid desaturase [Rhizomicrobium sp.]|jgi:sphingolipid delta-4 desaturase|nr:fatty acid desaturase [Rhizomicrobium sp.]
MRPEPDHSARRAALLSARPGLKALAGPTAATAWLAIGACVLQFGLAALIAHQPWWEIALCALFFGAFAIHFLNCVVHECTHGLVFANASGNRLVAIVANMPSLVPSAMAFWHYHLLHHYHFGVRGMDSDVPAQWEARTVKTSALRKLLWLLLLPVSYGLLHPLNVRARLPFDRWLALNIALCGLAWAGVLAFIGWHGVVYLLLSTYFATGPHPAGAHILQEHLAFDGGNGMASYYGPINLVSVNLGYHLEHHDMPGVSGWRLPKLRRAAPEFYNSHYEHRSRLLGLWKFVFDRKIALDSRSIRDFIPSGATGHSA